MKKTAIATVTASIIFMGTSAVMAQGPGSDGRGRPNSLFKVIDTDADGQLSAEEISRAGEALLTLDKDGDGVVSAQEVFPRGQGQRGQRGQGREARNRDGQGGPGGRGPQGKQFVERVMQLDENGDGQLTADELPERMQRLVDRCDEDGDGTLTEAELQSASEKFAGRRQRPQGQPRRLDSAEPEAALRIALPDHHPGK